MKYRIIFSFLFLAVFSGCKNGAESIPELAGKIFEAVKSNKEKDLLKCAPSSKETVLAYQLYYSDIYPEKTERDKIAMEKAASMRLSLTLAFRNILSEAREKGIDWKTAKLLDLKYSTKDRTEGFTEAKVRIITESNVGKNVIVFEAMESEKMWYLMEKLAWEE